MKENRVQEIAVGVAGLIRRAKARDQAAFADLCRLTVTPVYRYLSARLRTGEEAEELTQEVFFAALGGIQSLRAEDEAALLAWLFQIARNKLADHLRQRYRRPASPLEDAGQLEASDPTPDEVAQASSEAEELRQPLDSLTPEQREVVICCALSPAFGRTSPL